MGQQLKKNFEQYASKMSLYADQLEEQVAEDTKTPEDKKFDLSLYEKLKSDNGKSLASIFFSLLFKVFDEEQQKVEKYFIGYLEQLISQ